MAPSRSGYNSAVKRDVAEILKEALTLPLKERAALAKSLVASVAPHAGADAMDLRTSNVGTLYDQARNRALPGSGRASISSGGPRAPAMICIAARKRLPGLTKYQAASSSSDRRIGTSTPSANRAAITSSPFMASMNLRRVPT